MSPPEALLWSRLRHLRGEGQTFRRQHPIGPFIADFCCPKAMLVVEVDGAHHTEDAQSLRDEARSNYLRDRGYRVLRVPSSDILRNVDEVAQGIVEAALAPPPPPR